MARRIVGIERHASDESAWKIAGDVGEVQAPGHERIRGNENLCSDGDHDVVAVAGAMSTWVADPGDCNFIRPGRSTIGALPEILIAACVHAVAVVGIGRDGRQVGVVFGRQPRWINASIGITVVRGLKDGGVASAIGLGRQLPVMRDVEAVASDAHLPGRGNCTRRGDNAVVLESAQGHARRRIRA